MQIGGLTQQDVGRFVEVAIGARPLPESVEAVHGRTKANPLFVGEVVRLLGQQGLGDNQNWDISMPEGVRDVIGPASEPIIGALQPGPDRSVCDRKGVLLQPAACVDRWLRRPTPGGSGRGSGS